MVERDTLVCSFGRLRRQLWAVVWLCHVPAVRRQIRESNLEPRFPHQLNEGSNITSQGLCEDQMRESGSGGSEEVRGAAGGNRPQGRDGQADLHRLGWDGPRAPWFGPGRLHGEGCGGLRTRRVFGQGRREGLQHGGPQRRLEGLSVGPGSSGEGGSTFSWRRRGPGR